MLFNSFFGLKLKKLITQLAIFIVVITAFYLIISNKSDKNYKKSNNIEIIYENNEFNKELVKKRVKDAAPSLKIKVKYGDTLESILKGIGFDNKEIADAIKETKKEFNPKNLIVGKEITIKYENKYKKKINSIFIPIEFNKNFYLEKINEKLQAKKPKQGLSKRKGILQIVYTCQD